jgi:hypothetical protein
MPPCGLGFRQRVLLHGAEPGLVDELIEPFRRRRGGLRLGLKLDSIFAVVSRYSKLMPVDCAAWRIAPVTCGALAVAG